KAPPHELPLRGHIDAGLRRGLGRGPMGGGPRGEPVGLIDHWRRMRGSRIASRMSETSVPTTVSALKMRMIEPARYMSCDWSARKSSGPVVGRLITTEMMMEPDTS